MRRNVLITFLLMMIAILCILLPMYCIAENSVVQTGIGSNPSSKSSTGYEAHYEKTLGTIESIYTKNAKTLGKPFVITWTAVQHAEAYKVFIHNNIDGQNILLGVTNRLEMEIPSSVITDAGTYTIDIVSVGKGYLSSQTAKEFHLAGFQMISSNMRIAGLLYIFFILICLSSFFVVQFKKRFEEVLPATAAIIVFVLYLCGIFDLLLYGVYIVIILSILSFLYALVSSIRKKDVSGFFGFLTPGSLAFLVMYMIVILMNYGRMFSSWDEFSHWGLVVKNIFVFDKLGNYELATTLFKEYPPATALFEYFMVKIYGIFDESLVYIALGMFSISLLLPVFRFIRWKHWYIAIITTFVLLLVPLAFYNGFMTSLLVDAFLAICFAAILYTYFSTEKLSIFQFICLGLYTFLLSTAKASGSGLVVIALVIICFDALIKRMDIFARSHSKIVRLALLIMPLMGFLFGKLSWDLYLELTNTSSAISWTISKISISNILNGQLLPYQYTVIKNFTNAILGYGTDGSWYIQKSYILWILEFVIFGILMRWKESDRRLRKSAMVYSLGIGVGFIVYIFSLLVLYMFLFTQYEAVLLGGMERYIYSYILGAQLFMIYKLINRIICSKYNKFIMMIPVILIPAFMVNTSVLSLDKVQKEVAATIEFRNGYKRIEDAIPLFDWQTDRISIISQASTGMEYHIANYLLTPVSSSPMNYWSLGAPYYDGDVWTNNITRQEWEAYLISNHVTYVYLFHVDNKFIDAYGELFENQKEIRDQTLFKVIKDGDNIILIQSVF